MRRQRWRLLHGRGIGRLVFLQGNEPLLPAVLGEVKLGPGNSVDGFLSVTDLDIDQHECCSALEDRRSSCCRRLWTGGA